MSRKELLGSRERELGLDARDEFASSRQRSASCCGPKEKEEPSDDRLRELYEEVDCGSGSILAVSWKFFSA